MPDLAEVLRAQPVQRGPVQLRGPADVVMHLRLELLAVGVIPRIRRDVSPVHENRAGIPVIGLAGQEVAALEQQDPLARRRQMSWHSSPPLSPEQVRSKRSDGGQAVPAVPPQGRDLTKPTPPGGYDPAALRGDSALLRRYSLR